MTLEIRKLFWVILLAGLPGILGAQTWNSYYFPSKSSALLEGVINHVIHSPLPTPQLDPRFSEDLPCLFYGKEMLGNYLYILKEKTFNVSAVSDQMVEGKTGFMQNFEMLQLKCYLLKSQLGLDSTNNLPTILSAIKSAEESSNYKSFRDQFLFQHSRKLSAADEVLLEEIYQLVKPFKSKSRNSQGGSLAAFAPIVLTERVEENEFCKLTEQAALVFQSMEYPKINWELRINITQNCSCSYATDQEPSFMSSRISSKVASTFRTSSPSNFVFIQTGDPEIHIREVACCSTNPGSLQSWPSRSDSLDSGMGMGASFSNPSPNHYSPTNTQTNAPLPHIKTQEVESLAYPVRVGLAPSLQLGKSNYFGLGLGFQLLAPVSGALFPSGAGRVVAGLFGGLRNYRQDVDSTRSGENWSYGGGQIFLKSSLGPNVYWLNGLRGSLHLSRYKTENVDSDLLQNWDRMQVMAEFCTGLGLLLGKTEIQLNIPVIQRILSGARPIKLAEFTSAIQETRFLLNSQNPVEVFVNFLLL